jgi:hypothetical protein
MLLIAAADCENCDIAFLNQPMRINEQNAQRVNFKFQINE